MLFNFTPSFILFLMPSQPAANKVRIKCPELQLFCINGPQCLYSALLIAVRLYGYEDNLKLGLPGPCQVKVSYNRKITFLELWSRTCCIINIPGVELCGTLLWNIGPDQLHYFYKTNSKKHLLTQVCLISSSINPFGNLSHPSHWIVFFCHPLLLFLRGHQWKPATLLFLITRDPRFL